MSTNYFVYFRSCFLLAFLTIFSMVIHATVTLETQNGTVIDATGHQVNIATYTVAHGKTLTLLDAICTISDCIFTGWSQTAISSTTYNQVYTSDRLRYTTIYNHVYA